MQYIWLILIDILTNRYVASAVSVETMGEITHIYYKAPRPVTAQVVLFGTAIFGAQERKTTARTYIDKVN